MKIVHTSDWHAGRIWKNVNRLSELTAVLDDLAGFIEREQVDLLLVSGDVFDSGAPNAEAERLVFGFFKRVGRAGTKTVVIAGNHDSPARLQAWGTLAELVDVRAVGLPRRVDQGGLIDLETRSGERARVAVVPFAPVRVLVSALEMAGDETKVRQQYAECMKQIVDNVTSGFRGDGVNLLMAHTHLDGAVMATSDISERTVHLGQEWAITPQSLPATAHYVALGHIHKPQRINAPSPTYYAGSPLQLDFGEVGEEKGYVLIDARPGMPARIDRLPYKGGKPLLKIRGTLQELEARAESLADAGFLHVTVPGDRPDPDLSRKVHNALSRSRVIKVIPELPEAPAETSPAEARATTPVELFRQYYRAEHGGVDPDQPLLDAFEDLRQSREELS